MNRTSLLILFVVVVSCHGPTKGPDILEREKFISTYIALLKQSTNTPGGGRDSTFSRDTVGILAKEGVTETQFRNTIRSYSARPEEWKDFFDEVIIRLGQQVLDEAGKASSPLSALTFRAAPSSR